jgi:hypothetical protein
MLGLSDCRSRTGTEQSSLPETTGETPADPAAANAMASGKAQCQIVRRLTLFGGERDIYLLNVCPSDEELMRLNLAINIALPGEEAVTAYFDTLQSFPNERSARHYAEENGLFDVYLDQPAGFE